MLRGSKVRFHAFKQLFRFVSPPNRKRRTYVRHSNAGIQEVEKAVREVNEIFKDLSLIVSQQGEQARHSVHSHRAAHFEAFLCSN